MVLLVPNPKFIFCVLQLLFLCCLRLTEPFSLGPQVPQQQGVIVKSNNIPVRFFFFFVPIIQCCKHVPLTSNSLQMKVILRMNYKIGIWFLGCYYVNGGYIIQIITEFVENQYFGTAEMLSSGRCAYPCQIIEVINTSVSQTRVLNLVLCFYRPLHPLV